LFAGKEGICEQPDVIASHVVAWRSITNGHRSMKSQARRLAPLSKACAIKLTTFMLGWWMYIKLFVKSSILFAGKEGICEQPDVIASHVVAWRSITNGHRSMKSQARRLAPLTKDVDYTRSILTSIHLSPAH